MKLLINKMASWLYYACIDMQISISASVCHCSRLFKVLTESECREAEISAERSQPVSSDPLRRYVRSRTSDRGLFRKQELKIRAVSRLRVTDNNTVRVRSFSLPWKRKGKARGRCFRIKVRKLITLFISEDFIVLIYLKRTFDTFQLKLYFAKEKRKDLELFKKFKPLHFFGINFIFIVIYSLWVL